MTHSFPKRRSSELYIPAAELKLEDSWYVTGLQGTGSDTIVVEDVCPRKPGGPRCAFVQLCGAGKEALRCAIRFFCARSEEHTSELQSLMRTSYAVFFLTKTKNTKPYTSQH